MKLRNTDAASRQAPRVQRVLPLDRTCNVLRSRRRWQCYELTICGPHPKSIKRPDQRLQSREEHMQVEGHTILNSWKEIAVYMGRGVRTVQRWEQDCHLPVHRPRGRKRSPVFAFAAEIDLWLEKCPVGINAISGFRSY